MKALQQSPADPSEQSSSYPLSCKEQIHSTTLVCIRYLSSFILVSFRCRLSCLILQPANAHLTPLWSCLRCSAGQQRRSEPSAPFCFPPARPTLCMTEGLPVVLFYSHNIFHAEVS